MLKFVKKFWMFVLVTLFAITLVSCVKNGNELTITIEGLKGEKEVYEFNTGDEFSKEILLKGVTVIGNDGKDYFENLVVSGLNRFKVDAEGKLIESGNGSVRLEVIVDGEVKTSTVINVVVKYVAPVTDDIIINGDFASGSVDPFTKGEFNGGTGTMEVVNEELKLTVTALGWVNGGEAAPRVETNVFALEDGKFYEVSFDVRANVPTSVQVQVGELLGDVPPYFNETFTKVFAVSTEMTTITYRFPISADAGYDINKLQLLFGYGTHAGFDSAATDVFMDNIKITEVSSLGEDTEAPTITMNDLIAYVGDEVVINPVVKDVQDAEPTVTTDAATVIPQENGKYTTPGEYTVTITATDAAGNEATKTVKVTVKEAIVANTNLVTNGDFASTTFDSEWLFFADNGCTLGQKVENGQLVLTLTGTPALNWHRQVKFNHLPLVEGKRYHINVVLTSSIDRKVEVLVQNDSWYDLHYDETKDVTANTDVTFDNEFTAIHTSDNVFFGIMLGKIGEEAYSEEHTVTVKSVSITLVDGGTTPVEPTYADENNLFGDPIDVVPGGETASKANPGHLYVWNGNNYPADYKATFTFAEGVLTLNANQAAGEEWWATQVFYTTLPFKNGGNYELHLTIVSNIVGNITVNGSLVALVMGENKVMVPIKVEAGKACTLSVQLGKADGNEVLLGENIELRFSQFSIKVEEPSTDDPVEGAEATILAQGSSATRFEGAGAWIWIDMNSIEMTTENHTAATVTATVSATGPNGEAVSMTISDAPKPFFSDHSFEKGFVRAYVVLTSAPGEGYKTTINLTITCNGKNFTATVNFDGTTYVPAA